MNRSAVTEDGNYTYKLHTRDVSPRVLCRELERLLGTSQWQVEMRHNMYNIQSRRIFDIKDLITNCQNGGVVTPRAISSANVRERALNNANSGNGNNNNNNRDSAVPRRMPDTTLHVVTVKSIDLTVHESDGKTPTTPTSKALPEGPELAERQDNNLSGLEETPFQLHVHPPA